MVIVNMHVVSFRVMSLARHGSTDHIRLVTHTIHTHLHLIGTLQLCLGQRKGQKLDGSRHEENTETPRVAVNSNRHQG